VVIGYFAAMAYFWCLKHSQVEGEQGCKAADRLGPYPTEAAAATALSSVAQRNEEWDAADERWDKGERDSS